MHQQFPDIITDLTPTQFELHVKEFITEKGGKEIQSFVANHNVVLKGDDGKYQIDVLAEFEVVGGRFTVLIECKYQTSPVKRDVVQVLDSRLHSLGAHKGMVFSRSGFQSGAIEFAKKHGIALVHVIKTQFTFVTNFAIPKYEKSALHASFVRRSEREFTNLCYTDGLLIVIDQDDQSRLAQFFLKQ